MALRGLLVSSIMPFWMINVRYRDIESSQQVRRENKPPKGKERKAYAGNWWQLAAIGRAGPARRMPECPPKSNARVIFVRP
jgi:hypothetical protein